MLILKNTTKQLFIDAGLEGFSVGRNDNGYLSLIGQCGKPLVDVTNFSVGSKLSNKEREITIDDYLVPMLDKHGPTIVKMISLKDDNDKALKDINDTIEAINTKQDEYYVSLDFHYKSLKEFCIKAVQKQDNENLNDFVKLTKDDEDKINLRIESNSTTASRKTQKTINAMEKDVDILHALTVVYYKIKKDLYEANKTLIEACSL